MKIKLLLVFLFGIVSLQAQSVKKPVTTKKPVTNTAAKAKVSAAVGAKPVAKAAVKPAITDAIYATIATNKGDIVLELAFKKAPVTVANFIALAEGKHPYVTVESLKGKPFYDGLKFHRVINDFMIQGGDPSGNGSGGPGYSFKDEITDLKHNKAGTLSMANSGPATNGSQFFITHKDTPWLDGKHTVFGYVTEGMPIVNAIVGNDVITKVTITRKGPIAEKFDAPKVFSDYFKNKAEDQKKQDAANAEAKAKQMAFLEQSKKAYNEKYGAVIGNKKSYFANLKTTATTTPSGLMYAITEKGTGVKPAAGTTFYFHYAGFFEDGNLFDSSMEEVNKTFGKYDANRAAQNGYRPFPFEAGKKDGMIPGFIEGLENMGFGDKAVVFIPSNLAYGERGAGGVIPPNTMLIFELEMREKQE